MTDNTAPPFTVAEERTMKCCKCGRFPAVEYPTIGPLCQLCEREPLPVGQAVGVVAYGLLLLAVPFGVVAFLAMAGM